MNDGRSVIRYANKPFNCAASDESPPSYFESIEFYEIATWPRNAIPYRLNSWMFRKKRWRFSYRKAIERIDRSC